MAHQARQVLVIGLDGASPQLVVDRFRSSLPVLSNLIANSIWGELESTLPTTTVPAWAALVTGRDPGMLGIYGPRQRVEYSYARPSPVTSRYVPHEALWDIVGRESGASIVIGVPPGYPPQSVHGISVSCSLTPEDAPVFTSPPELSAQINRWVGRYQFDVRHLPADAGMSTLPACARELAVQRFSVLRTLIATRPWSLAMLVDVSIDRLQHAFWHDEELLRAHYAVIDREIEQTLALVDTQTVVAVVSDHGARASRGAFAINDWLIREGLLRLQHPLDEPVPLERANVDWSRTTAWAEGGPTVRLMINVIGRDPSGTVEPRVYEQLRNELKRKLEQLAGPDGKVMGNRAYKPEEIYTATHRAPPDLVCSLGNMAWRGVGTVGHADLFLPPVPGVSTGNHADHGLLALHWPHHGPNGKRQGIRLLDIFPTLLAALDLPQPEGLPGHAIVA